VLTNGLKSSEFWTTLAAVAVGLVLVLTNHLDGDTYWQFAAIGTGAYAVSRGLAKTEPVVPPDDKG
jgi:hypothetical protein